MASIVTAEPLAPIAIPRAPPLVRKPTASAPPRSGLLWTLTLLLAPALYTLAIIRESLTQGRLTFPPTFDDVTYILDGARRAADFYQGGVPALLRGYIHQPPHSPLSSALATLAALLFGPADWGPYATNYVVILGIAALLNHTLRARPVWERAFILLAAAPVPILIESVHEFRPDIASAALQSAAVVLLLDPAPAPTPRRRDLVAGALFGASILAKPAAFPATLILAAGTLLLSVLAEWRRSPGPVHSGARRLLTTLAALALVAGPHLALDWRAIWDYITFNMLGPGKRLWTTQMPLSAHLRYYIDGVGGDFMLGRYAWPLLVLVLAATIHSAAARRLSPERKLKWFSLLVLLAGLWLLSTANTIKQQFFGAPFQMLLLAMSVLAVRDLRPLFSSVRAPGALWPALLAVLALASLLPFRWPTPWGAPNRAEPVAARRAISAVATTVARKAAGRQVTMILTFTGNVSGPNLELATLHAGADLRTRSFEAAQTLDDYRVQLPWATFVLTADPGTGLAYESFPSAALLAPTQSLFHAPAPTGAKSPPSPASPAPPPSTSTSDSRPPETNPQSTPPYRLRFAICHLHFAI